MSKIEILQVGPYPEWDQKPLEEEFTVHRYFEADDKPAFLRRVGGAVRGVACRGESIVNRQMIEAMPKLEVISVYGVGYDGVDLDVCRQRNIRVANTPDVLTNDVADLVVGMMLALGRGIVPADHWVRSGAWKDKGPCPLMHRVHGRRAGILGLGRIGQAVGRRLAGFDMPIAYFSRAKKPEVGEWTYFDSPVELAGWADVLFVTLAATPQTRHIVDQQVLEALGPEGMLVNVSRAANVDEEALLDALENRSLGGAALDVFENEPALNPRFAPLDNVLLQPHQGSGTVETRKAMGKLMRDNLGAHFSGNPLLTPVI
ncbi:MAG: 2-hydroxyacid dehydrogenase [Rhizobiaceae bacterium]|nr:2-hydroxyacid dehydrogenase [Rhizobiaceae bacterium]MCV0408404.1 2-hydroxyacid dehydrogenase [Rhizobiaceae bacterium]